MYNKCGAILQEYYCLTELKYYQIKPVLLATPSLRHVSLIMLCVISNMSL